MNNIFEKLHNAPRQSGPKRVWLTHRLFSENQPESSLFLAQRVLEYYDNLDQGSKTRRSISIALNALVRWCDDQDVEFWLDDLNAQRIETFLSTAKNAKISKNYRIALRKIYKDLIEQGLVHVSPILDRKNGQGFITQLPDIVLRAGEPIVELVSHFLEIKYPGWRNGIDAKKRELTALRALEKWMNNEKIFDLRDLSQADGHAFLQSIINTSTIRTRREISSALQRIFNAFYKNEALEENPFPYFIEDALRRDQTIQVALEITQATDKKLGKKTENGFENALRRFLAKRKRKLAYSLHATAINHFSAWLRDVMDIGTLDKITPDIMRDYSKLGLNGLSDKTKIDYYSHINVFMQFLYSEALISTDLSAAIGYDKNHIPSYDAICKNTTFNLKKVADQETNSRQKRRKRPEAKAVHLKDFSQRNHLRYHDRVKLYEFIVNIEAYAHIDNLSTARPILRQVRPTIKDKVDKSCWTLCHSLEVVHLVDGERRFTEKFVAAYNAEDQALRQRARKFMTRHLENIGYFAEEAEESLSKSRPIALLEKKWPKAQL